MSHYVAYGVVKRFFTTHFKEELQNKQPIQIPKDKQQDFMDQYKKRIVILEGAEKRQGYYETYYYKNLKITDYFTCDEHNFTLFFNKENIFSIEFSMEKRPIYQFSQFEKFIYIVNKHYVQNKRKWQKQNKIENLKKQAKLGKIKFLAKKYQFNFAMKEMMTKSKLIIQYDNEKYIEVDIPHKIFQKTLQKLEKFICALNEQKETGIIFRIKHGSYRWTKYEDL